jgi:hypothetical protein
VQVLFRGHSTFTEVPDDTPPGSQAPVFRADTASTIVSHGAEAPVLTSAAGPSASASMPTLHDTTPVLLSSGSPQLVSVASVVSEGPALTIERGGIGPSSGGDGGGSGEIGRDGEHFASLSIDSAAYADHGWFVVPSASNEYGEAVATAGDGFSFDVAAGTFTGDWVFIA